MSRVWFDMEDALTSGGGLGFFVAKAGVCFAGEDTIPCITNDISPFLHQRSGAVVQLQDMAVKALGQRVFDALDPWAIRMMPMPLSARSTSRPDSRLRHSSAAAT